MNNLYAYNNYLTFLKEEISQMQVQGKGILSKIAKNLAIHSSTLSQILRGDKNFTPEQALKLAKILELDDEKTQYWMLLVDYSRANSHELKGYIKKQIDKIQASALKKLNLKQSPSSGLDISALAQFYSSWMYSAVHILITLDTHPSIDEIQKILGRSREEINKVIDFLTQHKLIVFDKKNKIFFPGKQHTHIDGEHYLASAHRLNWRRKALEHIDCVEAGELLLSAPVSLSKKDFFEIREILNETVKRIFDKIKASGPCEVAACLNLDWFAFIK